MSLRRLLTRAALVYGLNAALGRMKPVEPALAPQNTTDDQGVSSSPERSDWRISPPVVSIFLSVFGLGFYAWCYFMALRYYANFGLTPEDVGWSQARGVARAALFAVIFFAVCSIPGLFLGGGAYFVSLIVKRSYRKRRGVELRAPASLILVGNVLYYSGLLAVVLYAFAQNGRSVERSADALLRTAYRSTPFPVEQVAGVDLTSGEATWTTPGSKPGSSTLSPAYYFGQANGTSVFFDRCTRRVYRVPTGSFALVNSTSEPAGPPAPEQPEDREGARRDACQSYDRPFEKAEPKSD